MERFSGRAKVELAHHYFQRYAAWAVGIAGFTPIPCKVFPIGAGIFYVNFRIFVIASVISRGARFFLVAALLYAFGPPIRAFTEKNFEWLTVMLVAGVIGGFWVLKQPAPRALSGRPDAAGRG